MMVDVGYGRGEIEDTEVSVVAFEGPHLGSDCIIPRLYVLLEERSCQKKIDVVSSYWINYSIA